MRQSIAAIAAFAAMTFASAASAAVIVRTYGLDTADPAAGFGAVTNFGTVTVTDNGVDLHIAVALANGYEFREARDTNHHDFVMDLMKNGVQDNTRLITNITSNVTPNVFFQEPAHSFKDSPFGTPAAPWNYAVDCKVGTVTSPSCSSGWKPSANPTTMNMKVAGVSINEIASVPYTAGGHTRNIFFAVDVVNAFGKTGNVGSSWYTQQSYAPEPMTWALMTVGFGFIGAGLRRRRQAAVAA